MTDRRDRDSAHNAKSDLQRAMAQLEDAITDLVRSARDDLSGKAADMLEETTRRVRNVSEDNDAADRTRSRFSASFDEWLPKTRKLYRDPYNRRVCGVCAGFARYFGIDTWVARLLAVTGMLFMPTIVFPAYFIAYFFMDTPGRRQAGRVDHMRTDHRATAPEFGTRRAPRRSLRQIHADLTDAELKLRRMETHVTSDQYALRQELDALDRSTP